MKIIIPAATALLALSLFMPAAVAADTNAAAADLKVLVAKVNAKLRDGKKTQADLAPELKEFDSLLAKYKGEKSDDVAQILLMDAMLYLQVFDNTDKGVEMIKQLQTDFPGTKPAQNADRILASVKEQAAAKKIQSTLAGAYLDSTTVLA